MRNPSRVLVAVLAVSVAGCARAPRVAAGGGMKLVSLDPVAYELEIGEALAARLSTRPIEDPIFAAQVEADGALAAVELVFTADDGTAITFCTAYAFTAEDYDRLTLPDMPPPYGDEVIRSDGRVLSLAGPFDVPFDPESPDGQDWSKLYEVTRDPGSYLATG